MFDLNRYKIFIPDVNWVTNHIKENPRYKKEIWLRFRDLFREMPEKKEEFLFPLLELEENLGYYLLTKRYFGLLLHQENHIVSDTEIINILIEEIGSFYNWNDKSTIHKKLNKSLDLWIKFNQKKGIKG